MARSAGFSVTISAVDQISAPLSNIGRELSQLSRNLHDFQRDSEGPARPGRTGGFFERAQEFAGRGSREIRKGLREIGYEARELGRGLADAFEPMASLAGVSAGVVGGFGLSQLTEKLTNLGESAQALQNQSRRIGVTTQAITSLGNAARLGGSSTEALSSGLEALGQKLAGAAFGQDAQAIAFFRQFGVAVRNADGTIRSADKAVAEIADRIAAERHSFVQLQIATQAFGAAGADLLPILRQGSAGIQRLREEGDRLSGNTAGWVETGKEFREAQDRVTTATQGLTRAIGRDFMEALTPTVNKFSEWIGKLNKSPEDIKKVETAVAALATVFGVTLVGALTASMAKLTAWWALPAVKFLTQTSIGLGLLSLEFGTSQGIKGFIPQQATPEKPAPGLTDIPGLKEVPDTPEARAARRGWFGRLLFGGPQPTSPEFTAPIPPPGIAQRQSYRGRLPTGEPLTPAAFEAISRAEGTFGPGGINYNMLYGGRTAPLTSMTIADAMKYGIAAGGFQEMPGTVGDAARSLGLDINTTRFTPEIQQQIADWIHRRQGAGAWAGFRAHPEELQRFRQAQAAGAPAGNIFSRVGGWLARGLGIGTAEAAPMPAFGGAGIRGTANYAKRSGALGSPLVPGFQENLVTVRSPSGTSFRVHRNAAPSFQGFLTDLEGTGYKIGTGGGFALRQMTGGGALSEHAFGNAIDINPAQNPYSRSRFQTDLPPNVSDMAAKWGLTWGGDWSSLKDPMHFEWTGKPVDLDALRSMNSDSKHSVEININGAPAGTRAKITDAEGPATTTLRTHYAFGGI